MACYAYEILADPILSDECFDWLAIELDRRWDEINHIHKHRIMRNVCKSSIAINIDRDKPPIYNQYPLMVMGATQNLIKNKEKYLNYTDTRPISDSPQTMADLF